MNKIKVSELFYSIQGEGRYMGVPSIFMRTFGCNFKCPSFGLPKGKKTTEVSEIIKNIDNYKSYDDLPLVSTGCDSYSSVYPEFKHLSKTMTIDEIVVKIMELLPYKEWRDEHFVITGGEPLLGWQRTYSELFLHPKMKTLKEITFETNGTQPLSKELELTLSKWEHHEVTFSVSPKLSVSGESQLDAIKPDIICHYQSVGTTYLKFVVLSEDDVKEALEVINIYKNNGFKGDVYLMPVGGVTEMYTLNNKNVAELALKHGLRYSDRLHLPLFGNNWGT